MYRGPRNLFKSCKKLWLITGRILISKGKLLSLYTWKPSQFLTVEERCRETVENMQKTLHQQLVNTPVNAETAPSILHLSSIVCFQSLYHLSLFVSGKYVPHIIKQISLKLESETASLFNSCLETVMASRKQQGNLDLDLINRVRQWALLTCGPNE